jgi:hypothetical protein
MYICLDVAKSVDGRGDGDGCYLSTKLCNIPEDRSHHTYGCENFKSNLRDLIKWLSQRQRDVAAKL